ncbi:MAG: hypothetical protein MJ246_01695 [Clostridia bacterium]|nr:hypothetical protein [Clostridia bacterium]
MIKQDESFDDFAYQIDTILTTKGDKARVDSYFFAGDSKEYFGGLYASPKYAEFMYSDDESVYFQMKDIFEVLKTYLPTLTEVCDDFEKINFKKIKSVVSKSLQSYLKENGKELFEDYSTFFEENLSDYIEQEELEGDVTDKYYKLRMNVKDFVKFESEALIKLKNDKKVSDMVVKVASDLISYLEKSKEYKKIRMTEEEFNTLKYNYEEELSSFTRKELDKRIDYIQALYTGVVDGNDDKYIELVFRLDEDGNLKSVTTEGVTILDDAVVSNLVNYSLSKVNDVKNKDIVPNLPSRSNLVNKSRNELYSIFENVKAKYDEKGLNFFTNLLGLDKIKQS